MTIRSLVAIGALALAALVVVGWRAMTEETVGCAAIVLAGTGEAVRGPAGGEDRFCGDFADPFVLPAGGRFHAFSTNRDGVKVPTLTLAEIRDDARPSEALPTLPRWAEPAPWAVWAPAVLAVGDTFVLYYTAATTELRQCISRATASAPAGPYVDDSSSPLVCPPGGAIDPAPFVDPSGALYLLWKDFRADAIVGRRLSGDGVRLTGPTETVLTADHPWEGGIVEGPTMVFADGTYHLLYSANDWRTASYAVGWARCDGPLGPCTKPDRAPLIGSTGDWRGPGGPTVFADGTGHSLAIHAWRGDDVGYPDGERALFVLDVDFAGGRPRISSL